MVLLGIYSFLEEKWYDLLEGVNNFVPILKVTDKVDEYVPSFILFLVLLLLLLVAVTGFFVLNFQTAYDAELTVQNLGGNPVEGAVVNVSILCGSEEKSFALTTSSEGKAKFTTCSDVVDVSVSKETYLPLSKSLDFSQNKQQSINLSAIPIPQTTFNVKIIDSKKQIISGASLEYYCVSGNDSNKQKAQGVGASNAQATNGFVFTVKNCTSVQVKASATGYVNQTLTLKSTELTKTITLEKNILKGTVIFHANSPIGPQGDASIITTSELEKDATFTTLSSGQATAELDEGDYTYTVMVKGAVESGSFSVLANKTSEVEIYFSDLTAASQVDTDNMKSIFLKLVDGNSPVILAEAKIFFTKGTDTNYFITLSAKSDGIIGPALVLDYNLKTFTAIVKANGYVTKIVPFALKTKAEGPVVVSMTQGGAKLTVKVVDDLNKPLEGVQTVLKIDSFSGDFDKGLLTDKNGEVIYKSLPSGTYSVRAKTETDEGTLSGINVNSDTKVTLLMVTGRGSISFNFLDDEGKTNPLVNMYLENSSGGFGTVESKIATSGKYTTKIMKAGDKIKLIINDGNHLPYESLVYTVKRSSQEKSIFLRKQENLPNTNLVQLILRQVYESDPVSMRETEATRMMPGQSYYLLFDLVLNQEVEALAAANFYVSPADKNTIDTNSTLAINSINSISDSLARMSSVRKNFLIDEGEANLVTTHAKQANSIIPTQTGLKEIPILLEVKVDANAVGKASVFFQPKFGDTLGLLNSKEFTIGQAFCMGTSCPAFLFTNYLVWNGVSRPIDDSVQRIQIGDVYSLRTTVANLTDESIGDANLTMTVEKTGQANLSFPSDMNVASQQVNVLPLNSTQEKSFSLIPKLSAYGSKKIFQVLEKKQGAINTLKDYKGNDSFVRVEVRNKNNLEMVIVATDTINTIYEKSSYPVFLVKTRMTDSSTGAKKFIKANWSATLDGEQFNCRSGGCFGQTDENGIQIISFDATNILAGQKIVFTAIDENNSNPAHLEITVTNPMPSSQITPPECLTVKIANVDIKSITYPAYPKVDVTVGSTGTFLIDSNCAADRLVVIASDIQTNPKQFYVKAGETKTVTLDGTQTVASKGGMLGAYPLQIMSIGSGSYKQIGFIDVIMTDPSSPFELLDANGTAPKYVYDFTRTDKVSGIVRNKSFSGRKDAYYPQMALSTTAVSMNYHKAGVPEIVLFTAKVTGQAMEGYVVGFSKSDIAGIIAGEHDYSYPSLGIMADTAITPGIPEEFTFTDKMSSICEQIQDIPAPTQRPEPDIPETDPSKPFYTLPIAIQQKIASSVKGENGSTSALGTITPTDTNSPDGNSPSASAAPYIGEKQKAIYFGFFNDVVVGGLKGAVGGPLGAINGATAGALGANSGSGSTGGGEAGAEGSAEEGVFSPMCMDIEVLPKVLEIMTSEGLTPQGVTNNRTPAEQKYPTLQGPVKNQTVYTKDFGTINPGGLCQYPNCTETGVLTTFAHPSNIVNGYKHVFQMYQFVTFDFNGLRTMIDVAPPAFNEVLSSRLADSGGFAVEKDEVVTNFYTQNSSGNDDDKHDIIYFCSNSGILNYGLFQVEGHYSDCGLMGWSDCWNNGYLNMQLDTMLGKQFITRREKVWQKDFNIIPVEGKVYDLGKYDATPTPEWSDYEPDMEDTTIVGYSLFTKGCAAPLGFISPDYVSQVDMSEMAQVQIAKFDSAPNEANPLIEYDSSGLIWHQIDPADIPPGFRMFLKNGHVYAEYIGAPESNSPDITFTLTKSNLLGQQYAVLTVRDWVSGTEKKEKIYQIKLVGNPTNCYDSDGVAGFTGQEFVPKLLFNWDWNAVSYDQCDSLNESYTYCDATQFTASLFKRLQKIQDYKMSGKEEQIPALTGFYAYLIKDNYTKDFLTDFDTYYSSAPFLSAGFNTAGNIKGYDQFISGNRIKFMIRNGSDSTERGNLPVGGLYRVELGIDYDNTNINSLFDSNSPNANLTLTFSLVQQAVNYNPFYETPFDGEVGKSGDTYYRKDYGAGITSDGTLLLNTSGIRASNYGTEVDTQINYETSDSLSELNSGRVLTYTNTANGLKTMKFNPSQPTPVVMQVTNTGGNASALYSMEGFDNETAMQQKWKMISSTVKGGTCLDFAGNKESIFVDNALGAGKRGIAWVNGTKTGKLGLTTTFFTPKSDTTPIMIKPVDVSALKLFSNEFLANGAVGTGVILENFDYQQITDYDTIQGIFSRVANQQMCMTQSSENQLRIWWNPDYLNTLLEGTGSANGSC